MPYSQRVKAHIKQLKKPLTSIPFYGKFKKHCSYMWTNKFIIMDAKKSKKVDLREKRGLFFQIGMVVSLAIVFTAFQWTSKDNLVNYSGLKSELNMDFESEWLPLPTERKEQEVPKIKVVDVIDIVDDKTENIPDIIIEETEGDLDAIITIVAMEPEEIDKTEPETFWIVEEMPSYPGGNRQLLIDIMSRVKYPEIAKQNGIQGKVFIEFVVNKKGIVDKVKVSRSVDSSLDEEAMRVIKTLSGWTPGMQRGKAVNVSFTVPINFRLN